MPRMPRISRDQFSQILSYSTVALLFLVAPVSCNREFHGKRTLLISNYKSELSGRSAALSLIYRTPVLSSSFWGFPTDDSTVHRFSMHGYIGYIGRKIIEIDITSLRLSTAVRLLREHSSSVRVISCDSCTSVSPKILSVLRTLPHRVFLRLHRFKGTAATLENIERGSGGLLGFDLSYRPIEASVASSLRGMKSLRLLIARNSTFSPQAAQMVAQIPGLVSLDISGSTIANQSVRTLLTCGSIRQLDISMTPVTNKVWLGIGRNPSLRSLTVSGEIIGDDLERISSVLPNLASLRIPSGARHLRTSVKVLRQLRSLSITTSMAFNENVLNGLDRLTVLHLEAAFTPKLADAISRLTSLRTLVWKWDTFSGTSNPLHITRPHKNFSNELASSFFRMFIRCNNLRYLEMDGIPLAQDALKDISRLSNLRSLVISRVIIGRANVKALSLSASIHSLQLNNTGIGDSDAALLARMKLRVLVLDNNDISNLFLDTIYKFNDLRALSVSHTSIGLLGHTIRKTPPLTALRAVGISTNSMFLKFLSRIAKLNYIDLRGTDLPNGIEYKHIFPSRRILVIR